MWACVGGAHEFRYQRRAELLGPLEMAFQEVVSHQTGVLGI